MYKRQLTRSCCEEYSFEIAMASSRWRKADEAQKKKKYPEVNKSHVLRTCLPAVLLKDQNFYHLRYSCYFA